MTADDLRAWRSRLGISQAQAARHLGLALTADGTSSDAIRHYERGSRKIPEPVARLCIYVERFGALRNGEE